MNENGLPDCARKELSHKRRDGHTDFPIQFVGLSSSKTLALSVLTLILEVPTQRPSIDAEYTVLYLLPNNGPRCQPVRSTVLNSRIGRIQIGLCSLTKNELALPALDPVQ